MSFTVQFKMEGVAELMAEVDRLDKKVRNKGVRRAVTAAVRPMKAAAKANVPVRYGLLKRSIDTKVKSYPSGTVVGIMGPRSDVQAVITNERTGKTEIAKPHKYAHLVEFGTKAHDIPRSQGGIQHHPGSMGTAFMRRAFLSTKGQAEEIMRSKLQETIEGGS